MNKSCIKNLKKGDRIGISFDKRSPVKWSKIIDRHYREYEVVDLILSSGVSAPHFPVVGSQEFIEGFSETYACGYNYQHQYFLDVYETSNIIKIIKKKETQICAK